MAFFRSYFCGIANNSYNYSLTSLPVEIMLKLLFDPFGFNLQVDSEEIGINVFFSEHRKVENK